MSITPAIIDGLVQFSSTPGGLVATVVVLLAVALVGAIALATDVGGDGSAGPQVDRPSKPTLDGKERVRLSEVSVDEQDQSPLIQDDPLWIDGHRTFVGEWYAAKRRRKKRRKLAKKGYVEWRLVDGTFPTPTFVKPKRTGSGVPQYKHDGVNYIFPEGAAVPSEHSGMRTFVHKVGEIDPINVRDPVDHSIPPDAHQEYSDMEIQTGSPGWLSDMSMGDLLFYGLFAIIILAVVWGWMNGGLA